MSAKVKICSEPWETGEKMGIEIIVHQNELKIRHGKEEFTKEEFIDYVQRNGHSEYGSVGFCVPYDLYPEAHILAEDVQRIINSKGRRV